MSELQKLIIKLLQDHYAINDNALSINNLVDKINNTSQPSVTRKKIKNELRVLSENGYIELLAKFNSECKICGTGYFLTSKGFWFEK